MTTIDQRLTGGMSGIRKSAKASLRALPGECAIVNRARHASSDARNPTDISNLIRS